MNPVAPTPPAPTAPASTPLAASAVAATAPVTNLPPGLANLTAGAILTGSVVGRDPQGHVIIQTPNGTLSLATALALPQGSTLSLQVQTIGAQIQMVVLSINQQVLAQGNQAAATVILPAAPQLAAKTGAAPGAPAPEPPAVMVTSGRILTATVVEPKISMTAAEAALPHAAPAPAAGMAAGAAPAASGAAAALAGETATVALSPFLASPALHESQPLLAALLGRPLRDGETVVAPKGTRLTVRIAAIDTDPAGDPKAVMRAAGEGRGGAKLLPGVVIEPETGGLVQLKTPIGVLSLSTKIPFPPASQIVLEVVGEPELPLPAPQAESSAPSQARGWPALEAALTVLARDAGDNAAPLRLPLSLPRVGPELAPALLAAVVAIKTGDVKALIGDHNLKTLDLSGHHDLAVRLGQDFQQLSNLVPDHAGGDWRGFLVPVIDGSAIQFVRFYLRRHKKQNASDADSDSTTRFVVDVDLSRMGAVQLDGLVKPKKFDLIIRSRAALSPDVRRDITKIFTDSLAATGHAGALSFQANARFAPVGDNHGGAPVGFSV